MRHILLPFAIAAGTRSVVDAAASARLVALVGRALRATPGLLCASSSAIDLRTIAAAADEHLCTAAHTQEEPSRRGLRPLTASGV
jgi:hypothetical protein